MDRLNRLDIAIELISDSFYRGMSRKPLKLGAGR